MGLPSGYAGIVMAQVADKRLLCMGLLSKVPMRSKVLQRFFDRTNPRWYTDAEKAHMLGLWFLPGLSERWIEHQFKTLAPELKSDHLMRELRRHAYNPKNRERWEYLGQNNVQFLLQPEVERYFLRRPPGHTYVPFWALPVINDHRKQGWTLNAIAKHYNIHRSLVELILKRSMFDPYVTNQHLSQYQWKRKDKK